MKNMLILSLTVCVTLTGCGNNGPVTLSDDQMRNAKNGAIEFSQKLDADYVGCSGQDSEPDGYVSCTIKDRSSKQTKIILCTYVGSSSGCKEK